MGEETNKIVSNGVKLVPKSHGPGGQEPSLGVDGPLLAREAHAGEPTPNRQNYSQIDSLKPCVAWPGPSTLTASCFLPFPSCGSHLASQACSRRRALHMPVLPLPGTSFPQIITGLASSHLPSFADRPI